MEHRGRCHCGALGFVLATARPPADWPVRTCSCSFCQAHAALYTADPAGSLRFEHRDAEQLVRYRFALRTADFLLCRTCGVYLGAVTADGTRGIVNTHALVEPPALPAPQQMTFDGEPEGDRQARQHARWTPIIR